MYDLEVVELSSDISFLVIVPPVETSCSMPGQKEFLALPVIVFEMIHLNTYQPDVISRYSRLSCILELDILLAQHSHREVSVMNRATLGLLYVLSRIYIR